jgi:hypothetical protein
MRRLIVILWLPMLTACGGGAQLSSQAVPTPPVTDAPATNISVLFAQGLVPAALVNDPGDESQVPRDTPFVATFDLGRVAITDDARGIGMVNDSWTAPPAGNPIKTMNYGWFPSARIRPWNEDSEAVVCTSFKAAVPESRLQGALGSYTGADIWLQDASVGKVTSGKQIIVSAFFFVDRSGDGPRRDYGPADYLAPLNAVQFGGSVGGSTWFTATAGAPRGDPWSEPQPFGFCLTRHQVMFMIAAASDMFGGVININDVALKQAFLSNETNLGVPSSTDPAATGARLASFFSALSVSIHRAVPAGELRMAAVSRRPPRLLCAQRPARQAAALWDGGVIRRAVSPTSDATRGPRP